MSCCTVCYDIILTEGKDVLRDLALCKKGVHDGRDDFTSVFALGVSIRNRKPCGQ